MPANQSAHGVITIHAPAPSAPVASPSFAPSVAALGAHAISTGAPPEPVVQHKTAAELEAEAAEQAITDASTEHTDA
jgi:hypothetical protein